jgi:hypothetical protein
LYSSLFLKLSGTAPAMPLISTLFNIPAAKKVHLIPFYP